MPMVLNTSHPLYSNLKLLIGVESDNTLVDLVTPSRAFTIRTPGANPSSFGTGTWGRHFKTGGQPFDPAGATFSPSFAPANNTGTLLLVTHGLFGASTDSYRNFAGPLTPSSSAQPMRLPTITRDSAGKIAGYVDQAGVDKWISSTVDFATNVDRMVTLTRGSDGAGALYLDGTSVGTLAGFGANETTAENITKSSIGGMAGYSYTDAEIVWIAWFDVALTPTQVADLYASLGAGNTFALISAPDVLPPTLSDPTGTATGSTTATGTVSTDESNGTLYRLASTNATETAATVKAAALTQTVTATGAQSVTFTGLTPSTSYYAHYVHSDAAANDSARVSSTVFTTSAAPATATTLIGPSAGTVGAASGVFTVGANGIITGTITITPSDGGGGGTFSPTSVNISSGTPTATFTYTAASVGAKTISISDTGSLTDATPLTYTASLTAGTLTSSPLKNNTGTVLAAVAFEAYVSNPTSGALVVKKTGLTSSGGGVVTFSDGALAAATSYRVVWRRTDTGAEGLETLTAT